MRLTISVLLVTFTLLFIIVPKVECKCSNPSETSFLDSSCVPISDLATEFTEYLEKNMFHFDRSYLFDALQGGIIPTTVNLTLEAKQKFSWTDSIPRKIFESSVLPYAIVDEGRNNWRTFLWDQLVISNAIFNSTTINGISDMNISSAALAINKAMWTILGAHTSKGRIVFRSEQTPLIYDPMSTITFGYASCTGVSILYVDALRTFGIPARLAGTPCWNQNCSIGNHNWVEVWIDNVNEWRFLEGSPAGGGESFLNPCDKWFCTKGHFPTNPQTGKPADNVTKVYVTDYAMNMWNKGTDTFFPMGWNLLNKDVGGSERSQKYWEWCRQCR